MVALWRTIWRDWQGFQDRWQSPPVVPCGLHTYHFRPPGGQVRVHLRVEPDKSGVLFVDVTDVVHLNPSATEIAKWSLDDLPESLALTRLRHRHGSVSARMKEDVRAIYGMVARLREPQLGCPTCALQDVNRIALFEAPVRAPFKADLAITYECNNDCPHCYNEVDRLALKSMQLSDWCTVVDRLTAIGIPHLIFTGGEATLYPDLLELIHYADRRGPICGLNSNGRRMAHATYAKELASAGLNHVQITLGSHRPDVHDRMMHATSFDQTVRGIRNALASGMHTITNTTLMRLNAAEIVDTVQFLHALGIRTFAVNGMIYSGGGFETPNAIPEQEMPALLLLIRDTARELGMRFLWYTPTQYCRLSPVELEIGAKRCNAGEYSICIEPNGDVLPCQSYYVAAGNILRDDWNAIWHGELFRSFRDRESDPIAAGLPEMCWECPDLALCGGGCRIEREAADGNRCGGSCGSCNSGNSSANTQGGFVDAVTLMESGKRRASGVF